MQTTTPMIKRNLFQQLTIGLLPAIVVLFIVAETLNYFHLRKMHLGYFEEENTLVLKSVHNLLQFRDISLNALESNMGKRMRNISQLLVDEYFSSTETIETTDLNKIKIKLGMNKLQEDIYIINSRGVIINTTYGKDYLLDFSKIGKEHSAFLKKTLQSGIFYRDRLGIENFSNEKRIYSYQATKDKRYIIQLGFYSSKIALIDADFSKKTKQLADSIKHIEAIKIYASSDNNPNKDEQTNTSKTIDPYLQQCFKTKKYLSYKESKDGSEKQHHYFYIDMIDSQINKGYVAEVVSNFELFNANMRNELLRYAFIMVCSILFLSLHIYQQTKKVSQPINHFLKKIEKISMGEMGHRVNEDGYREIAELSKNFNIMVDRIEAGYNELEEKVQRRTADLEKTNIQLKSLITTKDKFFSIISHDLKNPVHNIQNLCELILKPSEPIEHETVKELVGMIQTESKYSFDLLINLLDWSRSQTGSIQMSPSTIDLCEIIQENINIFSTTAQNKNIILHSELDAPLLAIADANMVKTVCRNLISNALKFSKPGGTIQISGQAVNNYIEIGVKDNGIGIPADELELLFKVNIKTSRPGTNAEKGTGIGLNLCQEFIKKNGGHIWAHSQEGIGSSFFFSLPQA